MKTSDLHIRPFERSDQDSVRQLVLDGLAEHFRELDPFLNQDLLDIQVSYVDKGHPFIVAVLDGQIVGSGGLIRETPAIGRIVRLSVASKLRRSGIGQQIVQYLINRADQLNLDRLVTETNIDWTSAIGLYEKIGFQEYKRDTECIHFYLNF